MNRRLNTPLANYSAHQPDPFKKGPQNLSSSPRGNDRHRSLIYSIIARRRGGDHSQPSFWIWWKFPMDKGLEKMKIIKIPRTKRSREVPNKNAEIFYYTLAVTSSKFWLKRGCMIHLFPKEFAVLFRRKSWRGKLVFFGGNCLKC